MENLEALPEQNEQIHEAHAEQMEHESSAPSTESSSESPQDRNWKAMRHRMQEKEDELRYLKNQVDAMTGQLQEIRQNKPKEAEPEEQWLTETERKLYGEIKQLKGYLEKQKEKEADVVVDRLRMRYPDFDAVVNAENVMQLKRDNPTLAKAIASMQGDHYDQAVAAYEILKKSGYMQDSEAMMDKAKLDKNTKKPMSVQAVRKEGPLGEANRFALGLTPELKKELLREMNEATKRS